LKEQNFTIEKTFLFEVQKKNGEGQFLLKMQAYNEIAYGCIPYCEFGAKNKFVILLIFGDSSQARNVT
jgi:hypothetical protein